MANGTPSTLNNASASDNGVAAALNGLFQTGLEFLGDNLFSGKKEDQNASLREQNAKLLAAITTPKTVIAGSPGIGTQLTPILIGGGVLVVLLVLFSRTVR